jgi:uncharacterized protein with PIN domain/sulfur carrier protein ThiS
MPQVSFRFYAELNDHLPPELRRVAFDRTVADGSTLEEVFRSLEVPANEIDLVLVNGESESLDHRLLEGDRVSVYPVFDSMDVTPVTKVENRPLRRLRFVLDVHLGKLCHHLRMLGFDTLYRNDCTRDVLVTIARGEDRILLSKDRMLLDGNAIEAGYCVKSSDPREQLIEVLQRFDLWKSAHLFRRCLHCNTVLHSARKDTVIDRLPEKVREFYSDFTTCPSCGKIYWMGTHVEKMMEFTRRVYAEAGEPSPPSA